MNRDHIAGQPAPVARAGTHAQTLALYRLLDELRARHPTVEIESLLVGRRPHRPRDPSPHGAGVDQRLQRRARTPDDPARRVDVDPARADGRPHRARAIAHDRSPSRSRVPGGDGVVRSSRRRVQPAGARRRASCTALAEVIALHKRFRPLLHGGDTVRFDTEPAYVAHGVYASDRSEAVVSFAVVDDRAQPVASAAATPRPPDQLRVSHRPRGPVRRARRTEPRPDSPGCATASDRPGSGWRSTAFSSRRCTPRPRSFFISSGSERTKDLRG